MMVRMGRALLDSLTLSGHLHIVIESTIFIACGLVRDGFFLEPIRGIIPSHVTMLVDLGLALVAIRRVRGLDTQTGSDQTESHLEGGYMLDTWMHRLGVNSS